MDGAGGETLQAKKRALVGQKDRLRLLKKMQTVKERVQRKMELGRAGKGEMIEDKDTTPEPKPVAQDMRYDAICFCPFDRCYVIVYCFDSCDESLHGVRTSRIKWPEGVHGFPLPMPLAPYFRLPHSRSVVPTTEDFDPALFMTVVHATASFNDIRNGLESLDGAKANQVRAWLGIVAAIWARPVSQLTMELLVTRQLSCGVLWSLKGWRSGPLLHPIQLDVLYYPIPGE